MEPFPKKGTFLVVYLRTFVKGYLEFPYQLESTIIDPMFFMSTLKYLRSLTHRL